MKTDVIALTAVILVMMVACRRDPPEHPIIAITCPDLKPEPGTCDFGVEYREESPKYFIPCYNPLNADEFVYRKDNAVWKYSFSSDESTLIKDDVRPFTQLDWGRLGWITFTNHENIVSLIKDDGSESRALTNSIYGKGPEFNQAGTQIVFGRSLDYSNYELENNPELREQYKLHIYNIEGGELDSFCRRDNRDQCYIWLFCSWSPDETLFAVPEYGIRLYDTDGNAASDIIRDNDSIIIIHDIEWHPTLDQVFFTDDQGLKRIDLATNEVHRILKSCDSRTYLHISISPDGNHIIASRKTATYHDCIITEKTGIVRMDIDGSNEEEILVE